MASFPLRPQLVPQLPQQYPLRPNSSDFTFTKFQQTVGHVAYIFLDFTHILSLDSHKLTINMNQLADENYATATKQTRSL